MKDPLDDIETLLARMGNDRDADLDSPRNDARGKRADEAPDGSSELNNSSPCRSVLDTLLNQLHGEAYEISRPNQRTQRQRLRKPLTDAPKKRNAQARPSNPIRKLRQRRTASKKTATAKKNTPKNLPVVSTEIVKCPVSDEDTDNNHFLQQMRSLAERKLQNEKRKSEAMRQRTIKKMQDQAAKSEAELRQIAALASRSISRTLSTQKRTLPSGIAAAMALAKEISAEQAAEDVSIIESTRDFAGIVERLGSEMQSQRAENSKEAKKGEQKLMDETAKASSQRKMFTKVLAEVENILKLKHESA